MIGKVTRGKSAGGLLRYLYGPGRANEHVNPHLVASWLGDDRATLDTLEPVLAGQRHDVTALADRLELAMELRPDAIDRPVWQCSMRVADGDRRLSDEEWASVARDAVERTGLAPAGDPGGCRWVAVRHADDHIHIAVVLARQDGERVELFRDWPKVHAAARAAEQRLGLQVVASPNKTAAVAPSRAEVEKAQRLDDARAVVMPARAWLTRRVRAAAAGSVSAEEFEAALRRDGVLVIWRRSTRDVGQVTGYAVGRAGDVDRQGRQVWFGGSKLSPDLSLPKLRARWEEVAGRTAAVSPAPRRPLVDSDDRQRVLDRAERALQRVVEEETTPSTAVAASEVASTMAALIEGDAGGELTEAAEAFSAAVRPPRGWRPDARHDVHIARAVASDLAALRHVLPGEARDAALILANLARIAVVVGAHPRVTRRLVSAATDQVRQRPASQVEDRAHEHARDLAEGDGGRTAHWLREALGPDHAQRVLEDPAWKALEAELARQPGTATTRLGKAWGRREMDSARFPAAVLHHRLVDDGRTERGHVRPQRHHLRDHRAVLVQRNHTARSGSEVRPRSLH